MRENTTVFIQRMNCGGCAKNVTKALQTLPGVEVTEIDLPTKSVHFSYDSEQTAMDTVRARLAEAKYPVVDEQPMLSTQ